MTGIPILHTCGGVAFHVRTRPKIGTIMQADDVIDQPGVKNGDFIKCNTCGALVGNTGDLEPDGGYA